MDPLSVVASTIAILQAVSLTYQSIDKISDRPKAFDQVFKHLPLVQKILRTARNRLEEAPPPLDQDEQAAVFDILKTCDDKAKELKRIFDAIGAKCAHDSDATTWLRARAWYRSAVRGLKANKVEVLMDAILEQVQHLAYNELFQLATQEDVQDIKRAIEELAAIEPSLDDSEFDSKTTVYATQSVAEGAYGQQNNPSGGVNTFMSGKHNITGEHATVHFGTDHGYLRELFAPGQINPRDLKARIERQKGGLLADSCRWIVSNPEYIRWRDHDESYLLYIKGDPGKGKTMLMCGIINELQRPTETGQSRTVIYFFCRANEDGLNTATAALRGILAFFFDQHRALRDKFNRIEESFPLDVHSWDSLRMLFTKVLQDPDLDLRDTYLVLDGLDECEEDRNHLLDFIVHLSSMHTCIKAVVSSRNWTKIDQRLRAATNSAPLSLELNAEAVSAAVDTYIEHKVKSLAESKSYDVETREKVQQYLQDNSTNTFLWVSIVCQALEEKDHDRLNVLELLKDYPPELHDLYQRIINQVLKGNNAELACKLIALMLTVYRPITLDELDSLIDWQTELPRDTNLLKERLGLCRCLLIIRDNTVDLLHQSVRDFLLDQSQQAFKTIFPRGREHQHSVILACSLSSMTKTLRKDMYKLPLHWVPISDIKPPKPDPLRPVKYSCVYWADHLEDSISGNQGALSIEYHLKDEGPIHRFLKEHFLHWLEAVSLLQEPWTAIISMSKVEALLALQTAHKQPEDYPGETGKGKSFWEILRRELTPVEGNHSAGVAQFTELCHDAWRFVKQHADCIRLGPSQIYSSALVFSPSGSKVRQLYQRYEPAWLLIKPVADSQWSPCLQTLEGHLNSVCCVAFSPDGKSVASGSADYTTKLWNTLTGRCLATFGLYGHVVACVAFSPNGKLIVSGTEDRRIVIWDNISCQSVHVLRDHTEMVSSVAFSPDGSHVVSGSYDMTVRLWDVKTGSCTQTLRGHEGPVLGVSFAPDGKHVASSSRDGTVKLWDIASAEPQCRHTFSGHSSRSEGIFFSADGKHLISSCSHHLMHIWDFNFGQRDFFANKITSMWKQLKESPFRTMRSIFAPFPAAFSATKGRLLQPNEARLVLYNTSTRLEERSIHTGEVRSISLSPDCNQVVSADYSTNVVKLWDLSVHQSRSSDREHGLGWFIGLGPTIILSPDQSLGVAPGSYRQAPVVVWDVLTRHVHTVICEEGYEGSTPLVFSPDGKRLAVVVEDISPRQSPSFEWSLMFFDMTTFTMMWKLAISTDLNEMVFSPDGKQLAATSNSGMDSLYLWDITEMGATLRHDELGGRHIRTPQPCNELPINDSIGPVYALNDELTDNSEPYTMKRSTLTWDYEDGLRLWKFDGYISYPSQDSGATALSLQRNIPRRVIRPEVCLSSDETWVLACGKKVLWIPPEWRPKYCWDHKGSTLAVRCEVDGVESERVYFLRIADVF